MMKAQITSLVDKHSTNNTLRENGFSFYINFTGKKILYDTGTNNTFLKNAESLNIKITDVDLVILSHAHFDHTGGLADFLKINHRADIYLHRSAISKFYLKLLFFYKYIGINQGVINQIQNNRRFKLFSKTIKISHNIFLFCNFINFYKKPEGNSVLFVKKENHLGLDDFKHEVVLVLKHGNKLIIFSGCSHNGFLNIIKTISDHFKKMEIIAFFGGLHFIKYPFIDKKTISEKEAKHFLKTTQKFKVKQIFACHCSGKKNIDFLTKTYGDKITYFEAGKTISISIS